MKKILSVLLILAVALGVCACASMRPVGKVVAEANENIKACQPHLDSLPLVLTGSFDEENMIYTLTLAISSEEDYKDYIYSIHYNNLVANGFNSLSSIQKEAVIAQIMSQSDKYGNAEAAIITLAKKELPMDEFEKHGITLKVVYQDRNGIKEVIE